jgi:hypothetical protein
MAKYIFTLEDNAQGIAITGGVILTQEELLAGKTQTPAIALGGLLNRQAYDLAIAMTKEPAGQVQVVGYDSAQPIIH